MKPSFVMVCHMQSVLSNKIEQVTTSYFATFQIVLASLSHAAKACPQFPLTSALLPWDNYIGEWCSLLLLEGGCQLSGKHLPEKVALLPQMLKIDWARLNPAPCQKKRIKNILKTYDMMGPQKYTKMLGSQGSAEILLPSWHPSDDRLWMWPANVWATRHPIGQDPQWYTKHC